MTRGYSTYPTDYSDCVCSDNKNGLAQTWTQVYSHQNGFDPQAATNCYGCHVLQKVKFTPVHKNPPELALIIIEGLVSSFGTNQVLIKVGSVDFHQADLQGNPALAYLLPQKASEFDHPYHQQVMAAIWCLWQIADSGYYIINKNTAEKNLSSPGRLCPSLILIFIQFICTIHF